MNQKYRILSIGLMQEKDEDTDELEELIYTLEIILNGVDSAFLNLPKAFLILAKEIQKLKKR